MVKRSPVGMTTTVGKFIRTTVVSAVRHGKAIGIETMCFFVTNGARVIRLASIVTAELWGDVIAMR